MEAKEYVIVSNKEYAELHRRSALLDALVAICATTTYSTDVQRMVDAVRQLLIDKLVMEDPSKC